MITIVVSGYNDFTVRLPQPFITNPNSQQINGLMIEKTTIWFGSLCDLWLFPMNALVYDYYILLV